MPTSAGPSILSRRRWLQGLAAVAAGQVGSPPARPSSAEAVQHRLAVCLGSGSLHGFAHIGAIRAFQRLGLRPDLIAGTSVGALAGVLWAAGLSADAIEELARDSTWREGNRLRWPRLGIDRLDRLEALIDRHVGPIETLRTRFLAVATELSTGRGDRARPRTGRGCGCRISRGAGAL